MDTRLPFGLRSAPITFLVWCVQDKGVKHICHYLDNFITVGSPGCTECAANLAAILSTCTQLGVPIYLQTRVRAYPLASLFLA